MAWTTPRSIAGQVRRWWDTGELLVGGGDPFPRVIRIQGPKPRELGTQFVAAQAWIADLRAGSRAMRGIGYDLVFQEIRNQTIGANSVPEIASIPTRADALALIGRTRDAEIWADHRHATADICPELLPWVDTHPLESLSAAAIWSRALAVVRWFLDNPNVVCYLREIDAVGVDTKFIAGNASTLSALLDAVLPEERIQRRHLPSDRIAARYRLLELPYLVPLRMLDSRLTIGGLQTVATPVEQLASIPAPADLVFITENATNGHAFPAVASSLVIYGLGFGLEALRQVPWLRDRPVIYWGDIDTHGFEMLSRLRAFLPQTESMLMDESTFRGHANQWVTEETQVLGDLPWLTAAENSLLRMLQTQTLGTCLRLEQERIRFAVVQGWLRQFRS